jgi:hypothetical protein
LIRAPLFGGDGFKGLAELVDLGGQPGDGGCVPVGVAMRLDDLA